MNTLNSTPKNREHEAPIPDSIPMGRDNKTLPMYTGENLDAVTAVTDSFKMMDAFAGGRTGGAVAQTSAQTVDISVRQGRV